MESLPYFHGFLFLLLEVLVFVLLWWLFQRFTAREIFLWSTLSINY